MTLGSVPAGSHARVPGCARAHASVPDSLPLMGVLAHDEAVTANWAAFHVGVPEGFGWYVYRYRDLETALLYVGMTGHAVRRADTHWRKSDWRTWVMSAKYVRCHDRDEAYELETKIRDEEHPLFVRVSGHKAIIRELDGKYQINHVTGDCYCNRPELTSGILAGHRVVDSDQQDPSGWM